MIDKIEKGGSVIFCFSDITAEENILISMINRFIGGDFSVVYPTETESAPVQEQKEQKPSSGSFKKGFYNFTKKGAERRARDKKLLDEYNTYIAAPKEEKRVTKEEAAYALNFSEGEPF